MGVSRDARSPSLNRAATGVLLECWGSKDHTLWTVLGGWAYIKEFYFWRQVVSRTLIGIVGNYALGRDNFWRKSDEFLHFRFIYGDSRHPSIQCIPLRDRQKGSLHCNINANVCKCFIHCTGLFGDDPTELWPTMTHFGPREDQSYLELDSLQRWKRWFISDDFK